MRKPALACFSHILTTKPQIILRIHAVLSAPFVVCCLDSINTSTCYSQKFKTLAGLIRWAFRFVSYLVTNPEGSFSRDVAQFKWLNCVSCAFSFPVMVKLSTMPTHLAYIANGKKLCTILQQFTERKCAMLFGAVLWLHLIDHISLTLDGILSILRIINVRNTCKCLR